MFFEQNLNILGEDDDYEYRMINLQTKEGTVKEPLSVIH